MYLLNLDLFNVPFASRCLINNKEGCLADAESSFPQVAFVGVWGVIAFEDELDELKDREMVFSFDHFTDFTLLLYLINHNLNSCF